MSDRVELAADDSQRPHAVPPPTPEDLERYPPGDYDAFGYGRVWTASSLQAYIRLYVAERAAREAAERELAEKIRHFADSQDAVAAYRQAQIELLEQVADLERCVSGLVEACKLSEEAGCSNFQCPSSRYAIGAYAGEFVRCKRHEAAHAALTEAVKVMAAEGKEQP